jgi:L-erythrulose 1-phosphate isomerase
VGTSWKMTKTIAEAQAFGRVLATAVVPDGVQPFVLPAHTSLAAVRDCMPAASRVLLGAQNAHWAPEGPGTGEISMRMAADAGARLVEMGHSERRERFGETDESVSRKARAAVDAGLVPLVCVGEPADVRDSGGAEEFVTAQLRAALSRLRADEVAGTIVAYEPVWAIGEAGRAATRDEVSPVLAALSLETARVGSGHRCRALLYGGSVTTANADDLLDDPHTDGLFIGRAAWDVQGFLAFLAIAGRRVATAPAPTSTEA